MKKVLMTVYAINPYKGSEDGTGWNLSHEVARTHEVVVITRKNNIPHIEKYQSESDDPVLKNMTFYGFDLPDWVLWLKKRSGERGYVAYFYLWQMFVALFVKRKKIEFDIAHSLNFHSDSHPNFLWMLGKPTFWGPVGHHPRVKKEFILPVYGKVNYLKDRVYYFVKWTMRNLDPFYRLAVWKSKRIFVINSSIADVMRVDAAKTVLLPSVACTSSKPIERGKDEFNVLSVGRFHYMKGFDVTIRSFAKFYKSLKRSEQERTKLILVGKGGEQERLKEIARAEGVEQSIRWVSWVEQKEMAEIYENAHVFLFPSHEGAGMVVPEAMSYGLPVLCFNNVGPGELCGDAGIRVKYENYDLSVMAFSNQLKRLFRDHSYARRLGRLARTASEKFYTWEYKRKVISSTYQEFK